MRGKPKIGWILKGDEKLASSRIHGINIHNYLKSRGWNSTVISKNSIPSSNLNLGWLGLLKIACGRYDVIIFQQVAFGDAFTLFRLNSLLGTKSCFSVCDLIDFEIAGKATCVVVPSFYLQELYLKRNSQTYVISDAIEHEISKAKRRYCGEGATIKLVWVGTKDAWELLDLLKSVLSQPGFSNFSLITISDHPESSFQWSIEDVWDRIMECDVAVIPSQDTQWYMAKSNNKLSTFMALGMPVIAHPVPSYQKMKEAGAPVMLASSSTEWTEALDVMRSPREREQLGRQAREFVLANYSLENIGPVWENLLLKLANGG